MSTKKLSIQLNLAQVARKYVKKRKLKETNASAPLIQYRFRSVKAVRKEWVTMEERKGWNRKQLLTRDHTSAAHYTKGWINYLQFGNTKALIWDIHYESTMTLKPRLEVSEGH